MPYLKLSVNGDLSNHVIHVNANSTYCLIDQSGATVAPAAAALDVCHSEVITVLFFAHHSPQLTYPQHPPPRWIVILSPGCARNINKDGAHFGVGVRSWGSYRKIEDCKQSTLPDMRTSFLMTDCALS